MTENMPVLITVSTEFGEEQDELPIEETVRGTLTRTEKGLVLVYDDAREDPDGPQEVRRVRITAEDQRVTVCDGEGSSYMSLLVYERGRRYETELVTPYGRVPMSIYTVRLRAGTDGQNGMIRIEYTFSMNGEDMGRRVTRIAYTALDGEC